MDYTPSYGQNMRGDTIELPSIGGAFRLGTALETIRIRGIAQATAYAGPESVSRIELGSHVDSHRW